MDHQEIKSFEKLNSQNDTNDLQGESIYDLWSLVEKEEIHVDTEKAWNTIAVDLSSSARSILPEIFKIAAALLIVGTLAYVGIIRMTDSSPEFNYTSMVDRSAIYLPDGSEVTLAEGGNIKYTSANGKRAVELTGRAYFDVVESNIPFVIETYSGLITVVGTSFEVKDHDKDLEVAVNSGKVKVTIGDTQKLLTANQILKFDAEQNTIETVELSAGNLDAWKKGYYTFHDDKFGSVIELLKRNHGIEITLNDPKLKNCTITGQFDLKDTERMVASIGAALGFTYTLKNQQLIITGKGC